MWKMDEGAPEGDGEGWRRGEIKTDCWTKDLEREARNRRWMDGRKDG